LSEFPLPLRIVIVGGVAGGASAAARARRVNERAEIVLLEKDGDVSFANCGLPYYIGGEIEERDKLLVATPELLRRRFRIDVRVRHEALRIDRGAKQLRVLDREAGREGWLPYDKLILAPGAEPVVPRVAGAEAPNVFTLRNLEDTDRIAAWIAAERPKRAVLVGAGFIGLEMVEQLARRGLATSLVELEPQVLPLLDAEMARPLEDELRRHDVDLHLGSGIAGIEQGGGRAVAVSLQSGERVAGDLVLLGVGVRPAVGLARDAGLELGEGGGIRVDAHQRTSDRDVYAVGDAVEVVFGPTGRPLRVALAGPANRAGRIAGEHAATGRSAEMAPVFGTSIVRAFGQTAGLTGLTEKLAERLGVRVAAVRVLANHHAGYYPGAVHITLKLLYDPDDGRVLGLQATGEQGIDKRLDVVATAMALRASVRDLAGLDLAYAPPFGAAKDPIHLAAFAACNDLDGLVRFVAPGADLSGYQVLDVREKAELSRLPLLDAPQAVHIPLDELRERLDELDPERPTVASCASGQRAYVAARILSQHGFREVYDLSGSATLRARALRAGE
jgi:NADPH-dependent 2,4-dienoyl-CoA reductase/sulfur reductase-like enzyme/rhodanese-related sulfurtransferase